MDSHSYHRSHHLKENHGWQEPGVVDEEGVDALELGLVDNCWGSQGLGACTMEPCMVDPSLLEGS